MVQSVKELLLNSIMAKFIWVTEISNKALLKNNLCSGMLLLDATEPQVSRQELVGGIIGNYYISNNLYKFIKINIPLQSFNCYRGNLN